MNPDSGSRYPVSEETASHCALVTLGKKTGVAGISHTRSGLPSPPPGMEGNDIWAEINVIIGGTPLIKW